MIGSDPENTGSDPGQQVLDPCVHARMIYREGRIRSAGLAENRGSDAGQDSIIL